jgi:anti-sigma factor RsiW
MTQTPSFRDVEKLSAYLDGGLKPSEIARLEARLQTDPGLAAVLQDLRQSRALLRKLPQRRAPRNFTLTPKMVGIKPPMPRAYPVFRFATVLATLLLFFTFATNFMAPRMMATAPSAPYGIGGYGGGGGAEPEMEMQAAAEEPAEEALEAAPAPAMEAPMEPAEEPPAPEGEPAAEDGARVAPEPTMMPEPSGKTAPTDNFAQPDTVTEEPQPSPAPPIGSALQIALAVIAILSALVAFTLYQITLRKWRTKAK